MKCPKCGYVGFEAGDRCRNCGYDFSLSPAAEPDLFIRHDDEAAAPIANLTLGDREADPPGDRAGRLDLDRLIGAADPPVGRREPTPAPQGDDLLPLFDSEEAEDAPLIRSPGPPRPPLAVRRASEAPRTRTRTTRPLFHSEEPPLEQDLRVAEPDAAQSRSVYVRPGLSDGHDDAGGMARLLAFTLDLALLSSINAVVVYLTMQIAGVRMGEVGIVPVAPMAAFLALLNGGYLVALTAASGQTIGKMATGIRVVAEDRGRLDAGRAVLRAAASLVSIATLGAGFLPALMVPGGRALHDRVAGTRVVRN